MEEMVIQTKGLTKFYGKSRGIIDVDVEVRAGEIFGFLGPNGAGKTTTIRLLLDFIRPTSGSAGIFGLDSRTGSVAIHRRTGYLPGELALYDKMTGEDLLRFFAHLRGGVELVICGGAGTAPGGRPVGAHPLPLARQQAEGRP